MAKSGRTQKVADQIQRELSEIVQRELRDPRVGLVTLTAVEVSADYSHATVFYTCLDTSHVEAAGKGVHHAAGFLRSQLAKRIRLYVVPELHFVYDESIERGARLSKLIDSVSQGDKH